MPIPDTVNDSVLYTLRNFYTTENVLVDIDDGSRLDILGDVYLNGERINSSGFFNVKAYGAIGNGSTNDTAALQAAINACGAAGGGTVFIPCGDYLITSTLLVPSYVDIQGECLPYMSVEYGITGAGAMSTLSHGLGSFIMLKNSDYTNGNSSISISRLRFHATNEGSGGGTNPVIEWNKVRRSVLKDCHIYGSPSSTNRIGIRIQGASEHNALFNNMFDATGITINNANRILIRECEVGAAGIYIATGFANMVIDCDLYNDALPAGSPFPAYPSIIAMNGQIGALIQGNQLTHATQHGIYILDSKRCYILGNEIKNSSRQSANVWSGINMDSSGGVQATTDNVIANNDCWDSGVGSQAYGISIQSSSPNLTNNNTYVGNVLTGNITGAALQTAGLKNIWQNNVGTLTGSAVASAATITVPPGRELVVVSGTTTITSVTAGYAGQRVTLVFSGALTFTDGSNLKLASNYVTTTDDTISLICDGTDWYETARSVN